MTNAVMPIMRTPSIWMMISMTARPFLSRNTMMAMTPASAAPTLGSHPKIALKPRPAPATLPILNAKPPSTMKNAIT